MDTSFLHYNILTSSVPQHSSLDPVLFW